MTSKKQIAVLGGGKIGRLVVNLLSHSNDYKVTVVDSNLESAKAASSSPKGKTLKNVNFDTADFLSKHQIKKILKDKDYVISCAPFYCNLEIAKIAYEQQVHYLDLTEDIKTTLAIKQLAKNSQSSFIPQCGLAPGFITIVTNHLVQQFNNVNSIKMRVGALPLYPHNRMKYNLTWSTEGLINEYCNPCDVINDGKFETVPPLEGHELLYIDGIEYEAFNTSGGLGTFAESMAGKVKYMDYKSIRYPGHRDLLCTLLFDLKFNDDRDSLKKIFERSLPHTGQDVVIIFVTVTGEKNGKFSQLNFAKKIYHSEIAGEKWGAIQITTAASVCAVLDMHAQKAIPQSGFIRQEDIPYTKCIGNRFGKYYS